MQQQLIEQTIEITPQTMHDVLPKLTHLLGQSNLSGEVMDNIVKSLFYGLWNFDKMINQHNLSTQISEILNKISKKNAFAFLHAMLGFLNDKWNFIDHHRINKFMQLVRYLIRQAMKVSHKKTDEVLMETIFNKVQQRSGIADHVAQLYFETICETTLLKNEEGTYSTVLPYTKLQIFERLLQSADILQNFRLHIMQKIYQKYKTHLLDIQLPKGQQHFLQKIEAFNQHILNLAKNQENDQVRKNLYNLIGFMKSQHDLLTLYLQEKEQKIKAEREKKKKKISKFKKQMIKQAKTKRKEKSKQKKKTHIMSRPNFQYKAREQMEKFMNN